MSENRYVIFNSTELNLIDFSQVLETSPETVRFSVDGELTFVKWNGEETPPCIESLLTSQGPFTQQEMLSIVAGETWTKKIPFSA